MDFEISVKELRAVAHNTSEALALQERIDALMQEAEGLRGAKRDLVDSLVSNETFIQKAKTAKLDLINQAVLAALNERGADAVLSALAGARRSVKPVKVSQPKHEVEPLSTVIAVANIVSQEGITANSALSAEYKETPWEANKLPEEAEQVLYEETVVLVPEIDEEE